jgi:amidohydrolase
MNRYQSSDFFRENSFRIMPFLKQVRRHIHTYPEAGLDQPETVGYLASTFHGMDVTLQYGDQYVGLVVDIKGDLDGPTIGLRADMDALCMKESEAEEHLPKKLGFRSTRDGLMHGCGHDAHCAILAGTGRIIYENRKCLKGSIRLLFQPGEEGFGGAKRMVNAGYLSGIDQVYALHCMPSLKVGQIAYRKGGICSAIDKFRVKVKGIGGHSSTPEKASDQVLAASRIICDLQNIVARRIGPLETVVVSACYINGGSDISVTVMPAECEFAGAVRSYNPEIQKEIKRMFSEICEHSAKSVHPRCEVEIDYHEEYPATVNDPASAEQLTSLLSEFITRENLISDCSPLLGSEDFSFMLQTVPGVFMFFGVTKPILDTATVPFVHNPAFDIDETALAFGTQVFSNIVFNGIC